VAHSFPNKNPRRKQNKQKKEMKEGLPSLSFSTFPAFFSLVLLRWGFLIFFFCLWRRTQSQPNPIRFHALCPFRRAVVGVHIALAFWQRNPEKPSKRNEKKQRKKKLAMESQIKAFDVPSTPPSLASSAELKREKKEKKEKKRKKEKKFRKSRSNGEESEPSESSGSPRKDNISERDAKLQSEAPSLQRTKITENPQPIKWFVRNATQRNTTSKKTKSVEIFSSQIFFPLPFSLSLCRKDSL
jgi:hypothetical protein